MLLFNVWQPPEETHKESSLRESNSLCSVGPLLYLLASNKETHEESWWGLSLCSVWREIHLQEPPKATHKPSYLGEFIILCPVWLGIHLQETPEETYAESYWGE